MVALILMVQGFVSKYCRH